MLLLKLNHFLMPAMITAEDLPRLLMIGGGVLVGLFVVFYLLMRFLR